MKHIVRISITRMAESCQRTTFYVNAYSDEGYSMTVAGHATGSIYTNFEGLSEEEARDRALTDAADWGDFLQIKPDPFVQDDVTYEPAFTFDRFTTRRLMGEKGD